MSRSSRIKQLNPMPDGAAIAALRTGKRMTQEALARDARISPRLFGDIERLDRRVQRHLLQQVADQLGVPVEAIIKRPQDPASQPLATEVPGGHAASLTELFPLPQTRRTQALRPPSNLLELRPVTDALRFWESARVCADYAYTLAITPTAATAPLIEEMMRLIKRIVQGLIVFDHVNNSDEFDREHEFPDVYRLARTADLLTKMETAGVVLLANTHTYIPKDNPEVLRHLRVLFAAVGTEKRLVEIDRGAPGVVWPSDEKADAEDLDVPF